MSFTIGSKVSFLREQGSGVILEVNSHSCIIEDEDGFKREFPKQELAVIHKEDFGEVLNKDSQSQKSDLFKSKKHKGIVSWEIDLHVEELVDDHSHMTNHEIVELQLDKFSKFLAKVEEKKIRKAVIIHGRGEGRLRSEIRIILRGINGCEFYDGDYSEFGMGATVAEFKYSY